MNKIKIEIKWAIVFVVVTLLWIFLERIVGLHSTYIDMQMQVTNLFAIPAIIIYVLALKDKKKIYFNGKMSYMQGFISGIVIAFLVALLSPFTQWIISSVITPDYFSNIVDYSVKAQYYSSVKEAQAYFNLKNYIIQSCLGAIVMGLITSAIVAFFLKSKN